MTKEEMVKMVEFFKSSGIDIRFHETWNKKGVEKITFIKKNEAISLYASTESGCEQCDSDGSNCNMIELF